MERIGLGVGAYLLGLGLTLVVPGCGLGDLGSCDPSHSVSIWQEVLEPGNAGKTSWDCGKDTEIRIDPAVPISARQRIIEHELGHARGVPHVDDPACAMRSPPLLDEGLCTFEVDRAKAFGGVSRVRILDEILREPTLAAMARWNDAAGETLFEERE